MGVSLVVRRNVVVGTILDPRSSGWHKGVRILSASKIPTEAVFEEGGICWEGGGLV